MRTGLHRVLQNAGSHIFDKICDKCFPSQHVAILCRGLLHHTFHPYSSIRHLADSELEASFKKRLVLSVSKGGIVSVVLSRIPATINFLLLLLGRVAVSHYLSRAHPARN